MPDVRISEIPELASMVTYVVRSRGGGDAEIRIALHLTGEMIGAGRANPVEILREVQLRLERDLPDLLDELRLREAASRTPATVYHETGAKPAGGSPHAVHRSNTRQPGARWDLEEGGAGR